MGRRLRSPKNIPPIESVQLFEDEWVGWWSVIQPPWRDTEAWPFVQEGDAGKDWGDLAKGGKDGLFLVVVSLGWWIHTRDPSKDSKVNDAIIDVTWVINNLVSLSANATNHDSGSDSGSVPNPRGVYSSRPSRKRAPSVKIGFPSKRTKRTRP